MHRIEIEAIRYGARGATYRVIHAGEILLTATRSPELDACRALLTRGLAGRLEVWRPGKATWDAAVDIEAGAQLTVAEDHRQGPRFVRWEPASVDAISRARHRGRAGKSISVATTPSCRVKRPPFPAPPQEAA
jgi:hypothetical protein